MEKIDFVIAWVDDSDPVWRKEFNTYRYSGSTATTGTPMPPTGSDVSEERYRDWGTLRYWFRSAERFAPWVNRIHLLTWGHLPSWIDTSNPKLNIVRHEQFIPKEYLPTFNSCPIELNLHRIPELSERFVYFNDDMFLCRPTPTERFFRNGLPCDYARLSLIPNERIGHNVLACMTLLDKRHSKHRVISHNIAKWFSCRYGAADLIKSMMLLPWSHFTGIKETHMPQPFLKETFIRMWQEEKEVFEETCRSRFRLPTDLPQWVMRHEQLATGNFVPTGIRDTKLLKLSDDPQEMQKICEAVVSGHYSMVCINDNNNLTNTEQAQKCLSESFEKLLPEKSSYEK